MQVLNAVFYGLDLNELQTYRERVNAVTVDDIQRVARTYLQPDRLSIVLVGNASAFAKQLAASGSTSSRGFPSPSSISARRRCAGSGPGPAASCPAGFQAAKSDRKPLPPARPKR